MTVESAGLVRSDYEEYGYRQVCSSGFTWKIQSLRKWLPRILYYFEVGFQKKKSQIRMLHRNCSGYGWSSHHLRHLSLNPLFGAWKDIVVSGEQFGFAE